MQLRHMLLTIGGVKMLVKGHIHEGNVLISISGNKSADASIQFPEDLGIVMIGMLGEREIKTVEPQLISLGFGPEEIDVSKEITVSFPGELIIDPQGQAFRTQPVFGPYFFELPTRDSKIKRVGDGNNQRKKKNNFVGQLHKLGIIGGMSPESTLTYYRKINHFVNRTGGEIYPHKSAPLVIESLNFQEVVDAMEKNDWPSVETMIRDAALRLKGAGCEAFLLATNTIHNVFEMGRNINKILPLLHIVDPIGLRAQLEGKRRLGLLGTKPTMSLPFYRDRLKKFGVDVVVPTEDEQSDIHDLIFEELCHGHNISAESAVSLASGLQTMHQAGAEAIILGCTELYMAIPDKTCEVNDPSKRHGVVKLPVYDSTELHCQAAANFILTGKLP